MSLRRRACALLAASVLVLPLGAVSPSSADTVGTVAVARHKCRHGKVALTFDDGPQRGTTRRLLRILHKRHAPATFFVQGYRVRAHPRLIRRMARAGHRVGNHTWNHKQLTDLPRRRIRSQLVRTNRAIKRAGAPRPTLMRPPYGATNRTVGRVARRLHLTQVLWTVDTLNWSGLSTGTIVRHALSGIHRGPNIILLHDGVANSPRTVRAVPRIIRGIRHRGYCVARIGPHGKLRKPGHPKRGGAER